MRVAVGRTVDLEPVQREIGNDFIGAFSGDAARAEAVGSEARSVSLMNIQSTQRLVPSPRTEGPCLRVELRRKARRLPQQRGLWDERPAWLLCSQQEAS